MDLRVICGQLIFRKAGSLGFDGSEFSRRSEALLRKVLQLIYKI